jgi:hypothetical protein
MLDLRNASSLYKKIALLLNNPEVDNNYAFDTETLNLWKGKYQQESDEKNELIVYDDEGKLFWHSINDTTRMEIIPITDTKGFSNRLGFITLLKEKEHTYLKGNDYSYTKKVNSD